MAISRANGLNPSQMRRLSLNQVAKVDLVRAEAIAAALGKSLADLFGAAETKAKRRPQGRRARGRVAGPQDQPAPRGGPPVWLAAPGPEARAVAWHGPAMYCPGLAASQAAPDGAPTPLPGA